MNIHVGDDPFRLWIRREESYEGPACTVRFETEHGRAVLGLRAAGREDPDPTSHYEEMGIKADVLRAGRFVHVLPGGQRRSYALSRLAPETLEKLAPSQWVELEPVTEYGFRYLVFPKDLPLDEAPRAAAAVQAPAAAAAAPAAAAVAPAAAARPAPVARASSSGTAPAPAAGALPPRQTPMAPELAHEALAQLSPQAALQHLKMEMAKVDALHKRVEELERRLAASQEREQDLLELLQKWQSII